MKGRFCGQNAVATFLGWQQEARLTHFISYASEDIDYAHALFNAIKQAECDVWMDKPPEPYQFDGLCAGQNWANVIEERIVNACRIWLVLSPVSVAKTGFVQREFRLALDQMNDMPDDQVFVTPVLTEECEVPNLRVGHIQLSDIHWEIVPIDQIPDYIANRLG